MTESGSPSTPYRAGWYPDPSGRYEFRYHNGSSWTADVSTDGDRFVDLGGLDLAPITTTTSTTTTTTGGEPDEPAGNGIAVASLSCAIVSVAFGWLPILFALGAVLAVLAIVFGVVGLRRSRHRGSGRGSAIAGVIVGAAGLLVASGGLVFTIAMVRALDRFENPGPHTAEVTQCEFRDGTVELAGSVRNDGDERASFTVRVQIQRPGSGLRLSTVRAELGDLEPGETRAWQAARAVRAEQIECSDPEVVGPLPFGVDPG